MSDKQSDQNLSEIRASVSKTLAALSDSVQSENMAGWIPFFDNSAEFRFHAFDTTLYYDAAVVRFRRFESDSDAVKLVWDTVDIQSSGQDHATVAAQFTEESRSPGEHTVRIRFDIRGTLVLTRGSWKFRTCELAIREPHESSPLPSNDSTENVHRSLDSLIKAHYGSSYFVGGEVDVDDRTANAEYRVYQDLGWIFEDPSQRLIHSYIVEVEKSDSNQNTLSDSVFIAIIRADSLVWSSRRFMIPTQFKNIRGFADLNNDGITDILLAGVTNERYDYEALWIISPDSSGGRLLNETDSDYISTISTAGGVIEIESKSAGGPKRIIIDRSGADIDTFAWNGRVFAKVRR